MKKGIRLIELLAEIKANFVAFFSITMFVCLGIGLFLGIQWGSTAINLVTERFFESGKMHDIEVQFPYGVTDDDLEQLADVEGVTDIEPGYSTFASYPLGTARYVLKFQSLTERIDLPTNVEGTLPQKADEVALLRFWAQDHDVQIGDAINLKHDATDDDDADGMAALTSDHFVVTALVDHPEYLSTIAGTLGVASIGSGDTDCVAFVTSDAFDQDAFDGGYPNVYLRCDGLRGMNTFTDPYQDGLDPIVSEVEELGMTLGHDRYVQIRSDAEKKIADAEADIADADAKLADAEKEISDGEKELADGEKEYADGEKEYADGKKEIADAERQLADGKEELDDAEGQLADGKQQIDSAEGQLADSRRQLDDAEGQLADGKRKLDETEGQLADGKRKLDDAKQQLDDGKQQLDDGKKQLDDSKKQLDDGKKKLDDTKKQLDDAKKQLDEGKQELADAKQQLDEGKELLDEGKQAIDEGEAELAAGTAEYEKKLAEYDEAKAAYDEADKQRGALEQGIADCDATVADLSQQLTDAQSQLETVEADIAAMEADPSFDPDNPSAEYQEAVAKRTGLQNSIGQLEADITQAEETRATLQGQLDALDATKQQLEVAKAALDEGKKTLDEKAEELEEAKELYAAGKELYDEGKAEYDKKKSEYDEGVAAYESGKAEYDKGTAQYESGKAEYDKKKSEYDSGKAEYDKKKSEYDQGVASYESGKAEYDRGKAEYDSSRAAYENGLATYNAKKAEFDQAKAEYEARLAEFREAKATYNQKVAELEDGKRALIDARDELDQAKADLEEARRKLADARNELADHRAELKDAKEKLADAQEALDKLVEYEWIVFPRLENGGAQNVSTVSLMTGNVRWAMALLFVLVGLFVCYSAVSRLVYDQIVQIGTKKAVGFRESEIAGMYLSFSALAVLAGTVLAGVIAVFVVQSIMNPVSAGSFTLPKFPPYFSLGELLVGGAIEMVLILLSTWLAIHGLLKLNAIALLNGGESKAVKTRFFERTKLWQNLSLYSQTIINNCMNDTRRVVATLIGVIGCTALIVTAVTLSNNVSRSFAYHYDEIYHFDTMVYLDTAEDGAAASVEDALNTMSVDNVHAHVEKLQVRQPDGYRSGVSLYVPKDSEDFDRLYHLIPSTSDEASIEQGGIWISQAYADHMHVGVGDEVKVTEGTGRTHTFTVGGVFEYYLLRNEFILSQKEYVDAFGEEPEYNVLLADRGDTDLDALRGTLLKTKGYDTLVDDYTVCSFGFDELSTLLTTVSLVYLLLSALMAIVVLLNLDIMFVNEKKRELIVLMINGFSVGDAQAYIYRDSIALTIIGIIVGVCFGSLMGRITVTALEPSYGCFIKSFSWLAATVGIVGAGFFSAVVLIYALRKIPRFNLIDINRF